MAPVVTAGVAAARAGAGEQGAESGWGLFRRRQRQVGRNSIAVDRHAEGGAPAFVSGLIAIDQFIGREIVFRMAGLAPLVEEVHIEGDVQSLARIAVLQREYVFRLMFHFVPGMAMLHPHVVAEDDYFPERLMLVEFQRDLLACLAQFRQVGDAGLDFLVKRQQRNLRRQRIDAPAQTLADRIDQHDANFVGGFQRFAQRAAFVDEGIVPGQREYIGVARRR